MFPLDLLADLPEPGDDEPTSLRADIADELADHLQCAFRREVLKDGDAAAAQRRALDRFGDPKKLARRLWRQAMWSRIMRQRIVSGLQWMVAVTAMLISGAVFWQQSQLLAELRHARQEDTAQRQALTAKLDRFELPATTAGISVDPSSNPIPLPASAYDSSAAPADSELAPWPSAGAPPLEMQSPYAAPEAGPLPLSEDGPVVLTLNFVQETEDGPPVSPASVNLISSAGREYGGKLAVLRTRSPSPFGYPYGSTETATAEPVDKNKIVFRSLEPDLYQLRIDLADGQWSERLVSIRDEKPRELTIICPGPRTKKAPVSMSIKPLPDWMQKKRFRIDVEVRAAPIEIGQAKWATANLPTQSIRFDGQSGLPVAITAMTTRGAPELDLRELPAEERRVFLPVGAVAYRFEVHERPAAGPVPVYQWPESLGAEDGLQHIIEAEEDTWELELPQEFVEEISRNVRASDPVPDADPDPAHEGGRPAEPSSAPDISRKQKILDQLQGSWMVVEGRVITSGGAAAAKEEEYEGVSFCFQDNTVFHAKGQDRGSRLPFSIDVTKDPMWIDIGRQQGTFRLENDILTISLDVLRRPSSLDLAEGEQAERYELKRAAPNEQQGKAAAPEAKLPNALAQLQGVWTPVASPDGVLQVGGASTENEAITIAGNTAIRGDGKVKCKFTVNGTKSPMWIDIENSALMFIYDPADTNKVEPVEGIFWIDGDTLTMRFDLQGQRPPGFSPAAGHSPVFIFERKQQP